MRSYSTEKNIRRPIWLVKARFSRIGVETFVYGCFFFPGITRTKREKKGMPLTEHLLKEGVG